jgi:hypothetical protein
MPPFWIEEAGAVEEEHGQHRDNPQPIDVISSFLHDFASVYLVFPSAIGPPLNNYYTESILFNAIYFSFHRINKAVRP